MQEYLQFLSNHPYLTAGVIIIVVLLFIIEVLRARSQTFILNPAEATHKINRDNALIIDLRNSSEYKKGHIIDAENWSAKDLQPVPKKLERLKKRPFIFVCNAGVESQKIAATFNKQGYNAYTLTGGMRAWTSAQLPIIKE